MQKKNRKAIIAIGVVLIVVLLELIYSIYGPGAKKIVPVPTPNQTSSSDSTTTNTSPGKNGSTNTTTTRTQSSTTNTKPSPTQQPAASPSTLPLIGPIL